MTRFEPPHRTGDPFRRRERIFAHQHNAPQRGGQVLLAIGVALAAFLFVGACSFSQASQESHASRVIRSSVAATTEVDLLLAVELADIRAAADASETGTVAVAGFPFDAVLTQAEARELPPDAIRDRLLDQAVADVYARGHRAFQRSDAQDVDSLTAHGMLNRILGTLTAGNHDRATLASWLLLAITVVLGALAVVVREGSRRFLVLGGALAMAGCLGLIGGGLILLTVRVLGGGSDPFVTELRSLVQTVAEVPIRNYTVLALLGVGVWALAPLLALVERRSPTDRDGEYEEWDAGEYSDDWADAESTADLTEGWDRGRA